MPPKVNLNSLKDEILDLHHTGHNYKDIAFKMSNSERTVSKRTLKRHFQIWDVRKRAPPIGHEDGMLRSHVAIYFMGNLSDEEIAFALGQQGWRVHRRTIARIRISQGLVRRFSAFQRQVAVDALWDIIKKELDDGAIEGYGRRLLQVHFKRLGCQLSRYSNALMIIYSSLIFIRDILFSVVRALDPIGVKRHTF